MRGRAGLFTDLDNEVLSSSLMFPTVEFETEAGDTAELILNLNHEKLDDPFEIVEGVTINAGTYDTYRVTAEIDTSQSRTLSGSATVSYAEFWDGTRFDWGGTVMVQPSARYSVGAAFEQNEIRLPGGDFDVQIVSFITKVQFSPEVTWSNRIQWDNQSDEAGFNSRLRYEIRPGRVAYIVFNSGYDTANSFATTESELTVKIGWTWRF